MRTFISNYWWGTSVDNHKIHWLRWSNLTDPKTEGGMGFRDMNLFNQAMLGKQGWRLLDRPNALCSRVLKGKYYPNTNFLAATRRKRSSRLGELSYGRDVLKKGLISRIGPGTSVNIWHDGWITRIKGFKPRVRFPGVVVNTVDELMEEGGGGGVESGFRKLN
jgi:hypothetical protein